MNEPKLEHAIAVKSYSFTAMASPCVIHFSQQDLDCLGASQLDHIANAIEAEVKRIEYKFSRYREDSLLSKINAHQAVILDPETSSLINYAHIAFEMSDGLFDITSGVLRTIWDFKQKIIPNKIKIEKIKSCIGWQKINFDPEADEFLLPENMQIDFGGFGKEYAADQVADICRDYGLQSALIDLGGDIVVIGNDSTPAWNVGIRNPFQPEQPLATIQLQSGAIATSGHYERFFIKDGKRYCHILNPHTAFPVDYWASISCIAERCLVAGTLSTIAMLKESAAKEWLLEQEVKCLLIDQDNKILSI